MNGLPTYRTAIVPASAAALAGAAGQRRLLGYVLYPAAANSIVEFKDAATDTGTALITDAAPANGPAVFRDLSDLGGVMFNTGLFVKPAGSGSICYVWYE